MTLVAGPNHLKVQHPLIDYIAVTTAAEMAEKCMGIFPKMDIGIMAAAVADYTPKNVAIQKIKKQVIKHIIHCLNVASMSEF